MKTKNKKICAAFIVLIIVAGIYACSGSEKSDPNIDYYTCPMHHQIHMDHPGNCPICGMKLVPVYKQTKKEVPQTQNSTVNNLKSVEILLEQQQLISLKRGLVATKDAVKEIRAFGRVAFDPELAVAQKEYVTVLSSAPSLKEAARTRLKILGMSEEEVRSLETSRKTSADLYLPEESGHAWVYATVYADSFSLITPGTEVKIMRSENNQDNISGIVHGLDPIVDMQTRSVRARIQVLDSDVQLKPNSLVDVIFKINFGEKLIVPRSAIIDTGTRSLAFVISNNTHFEAREIGIGDSVGEDVIVLSGLEKGETVVTSAAFLVDSETSLRGVISGM